MGNRINRYMVSTTMVCMCDPSLNHRKAYGLDVVETYLPGSLVVPEGNVVVSFESEAFKANSIS